MGSSLDDRGLVIFVFLAEKVVRLEVGYGLEGLVPDAISHRIAERIAARIAKGELAPALGDAIEALKPALATLDRIDAKSKGSEWLPDFVLATIDAARGAGFFVAHRQEIPRQFASWWKAQDPGSRPIVAGIGGLLALFVALCLRPVLGGALFLLLPRRWTAPGAFYGLFFWGTDARLGRTLRGGGPALGKIDRASIAVDLLPYVWSAFVATGLLLGLFITVVGHPGGFGGAGAWAGGDRVRRTPAEREIGAGRAFPPLASSASRPAPQSPRRARAPKAPPAFALCAARQTAWTALYNFPNQQGDAPRLRCRASRRSMDARERG